jgi:ankyrin repeat protein
VYECGANVNEQDNNGDTPLHVACSGYQGQKAYGHCRGIDGVGADVNITNDDKRTPAQEAIYRKHEELLPLLDRTSLMDTYMRRQQLKLIL